MSASPVFISHPSSLEHDTGGHPENVRRIVAVQAELERNQYFGWEQVTSRAVSRELLERVHTAAYVDAIARIASEGGGQLDPDTVMGAESYRAALHAAGGAVELVRALLDDDRASGFSAHRPPGHHALAARAMGFCLFNNVAVAARYATDLMGLERVLVLDWDVHHGNGTQDLFWEDPNVLFCSIHQSPFWPGSGRTAEVGRGDGHGYTVNLPVPAGSGDGVFVSLVRDVAVPLARAYEPQLILVSAGYDAHLEDPLAGCTVSDAGYGAMTVLVRELAAELGVPFGFVLEGGYNVETLGRCVALTMKLAAAEAAHAPDADVAAVLRCGLDPLAAQARASLSEFWTTLA
jgi:acetoin utilization deacetylase AcuC-like enzyme